MMGRPSVPLRSGWRMMPFIFPTTVSGVMINSEACFRAALTYSARLVRGLPVRGGQQRMIDDAADVGGGQVGILQQQRRVSENRLAVVAGFDQTVAVFVGEGRMPEKARNMFDHGFRRV